jgi:aminopeptidase-like protein
MSLDLDLDELGESGRDLYSFTEELFPICRSITGNGIRQTLAKINQKVPLDVVEVASGTPVFDWTVPKEWNIRDAYVMDPSGARVIDFQRNNLHVLNYSVPVDRVMTLDELRPHLFTIPEQPDCVPYRTSYYKEAWGFCLAHNEYLKLKAQSYRVRIDSNLENGNLSYGELFLAGRQSDEVLISSHICHPSLANDNLSGLAVASFLAQFLSKCKTRYSYRFLFIPGTIGAITWLARNQAAAGRIRHGMVLTCLGDGGKFHYKKSRRGTATIDRAAAHVLSTLNEGGEILEFSPYGYDERQYCSPGFNLPVGCLMRSVWGTFPEYHTSADNLGFISAERLGESLRICGSIIAVLENDRRYCNQYPYCEPQLGRRNLYSTPGGPEGQKEMLAKLWVLNLSDGKHSLLDIAERAGLPFSLISSTADILVQHGLMSPLPDGFEYSEE